MMTATTSMRRNTELRPGEATYCDNHCGHNFWHPDESMLMHHQRCSKSISCNLHPVLQKAARAPATCEQPGLPAALR